MSSEIEKRCSIEELKERNLPPEDHPTAEEWEKKIALGRKPDDREEQNMTLSM